MDYTLQMAEEFIEEFEEICDYLSFNLNAFNAAYRIKEITKHKFFYLGEEPRMYAQINKLSKTKASYRRIVINNYIILYTIDDDKKIVYIAHMYYGGRNYIDSLL